MGISGTRGDLRKDVENGDLGRERGDLLEVFYRRTSLRVIMVINSLFMEMRMFMDMRNK